MEDQEITARREAARAKLQPTLHPDFHNPDGSRKQPPAVADEEPKESLKEKLKGAVRSLGESLGEAFSNR
jgi:hypothetical protein